MKTQSGVRKRRIIIGAKVLLSLALTELFVTGCSIRDARSASKEAISEYHDNYNNSDFGLIHGNFHPRMRENLALEEFESTAIVFHREFGRVTATDNQGSEIEVKGETTAIVLQETEFASFIERVKTVLGDKVKDVRITHRLTSTPSCIVADNDDMSTQMSKLMAQMGQPVPESKPIFELNPEHVMIVKLADMADEEQFAQWSELLLEQAVLSEKGSLDDPSEFVSRINKLLLG